MLIYVLLPEKESRDFLSGASAHHTGTLSATQLVD